MQRLGSVIVFTADITREQAEAIIADLVRRGIVEPDTVDGDRWDVRPSVHEFNESAGAPVWDVGTSPDL